MYSIIHVLTTDQRHVRNMTKATYSKHRKFSIVIKKSLLFSQLLILAQTFAEEVADASVAC
jgi:hypothetical protein